MYSGSTDIGNSAKIRRVYLIFKSAVDMRRHIVTFGETLSVIAASLVVDIVVLIVWTVVDPLAWTRVTISEDQFGEPLESVGYCKWETCYDGTSQLERQLNQRLL